jgi:hypothetical protein
MEWVERKWRAKVFLRGMVAGAGASLLALGAAPDPESANREVLAGLQGSYAEIALDGEFPAGSFMRILANAGGFSVDVPAALERGKLVIHAMATTIGEGFVWLGRECGLEYSVGDNGELRVRPSTKGVDPRCLPGGAGVARPPDG